MIESVRRLFYSFLWLLPFLAFLSGYQLLRFITHTQFVKVPSVVGLHINDAIKQLSSEQLNVRILTERIESDVPEGLIISQTPAPESSVKPHQSVFLAISRKPLKIRAVSFYGLSVEEAQQKAEQLGIKLKIHFLESNRPKDTCIAQDKVPGQEIEDKLITVYASQGVTPIRLFPDVRGQVARDIADFFKPYKISAEIITSSGDKGSGSQDIQEQRPLPGSLIDVDKAISVQLIT